MKKILITENQFDKTLFYQSWFVHTNEIFVDVPEEYYNNCIKEDFDFISGSYSFNEAKYNARKNCVINSNRIAELKRFLDNEWRWQWERYNCELNEIEMGFRNGTTQTREELILARKNAVDEINELED